MTQSDEEPAADRATPDGLGPSGALIWAEVAGAFTLTDRETALLTAAARSADMLDQLAAAIARDGVTVTGPRGVTTHPALAEHRQQAQTLSRLLASINVPLDDEDEAASPTRGRGPGTGSGQHGRFRGAYRPRLHSVPETA